MFIKPDKKIKNSGRVSDHSVEMVIINGIDKIQKYINKSTLVLVKCVLGLSWIISFLIVKKTHGKNGNTGRQKLVIHACRCATRDHKIGFIHNITFFK